MSLPSDRILPRLCALHALMRDAIHEHVTHTALEAMAAPGPLQGGDVVYALDSRGEEILLPWCEAWGRETPFLLVCEGLEGGRRLFGTGEVSSAQFIMICDPIDGTRPLMYDKRSAWLLLGVAPNVENAGLRDIEIAVQGELPASKAGWADCFWATRGEGAYGESQNLFTGATRTLRVQPSQATSIAGGYAMLSKFFVGSKTWLSELEEALVEGILGEPPAGIPLTFDDQYISNGGQFYELMTGRDRFNADLRPLAHQKIYGDGSARLCSHPYDCCTALIAREAGIFLTDPHGNDLNAPLDVESPVAWIGYANAHIRAQVEPLLLRLLDERLA